MIRINIIAKRILNTTQVALIRHIGDYMSWPRFPHKWSFVISSDVSLLAYYVVKKLSSTFPQIGPYTAYVVFISVSLGFRQKPSDMALLSVIALTTFNCIVSASVTKGVLVCFVVTVH